MAQKNNLSALIKKKRMLQKEIADRERLLKEQEAIIAAKRKAKDLKKQLFSLKVKTSTVGRAGAAISRGGRAAAKEFKNVKKAGKKGLKSRGLRLGYNRGFFQ